MASKLLPSKSDVQRTKILDRVWVIVLPNNTGIIYDTISTSAQQSWQKLAERELLGIGVNNKLARFKGYRAKKVEIVLVQ